MSPIKKRATGDELFKARLAREGRLEAFQQECVRLCRDEGVSGIEAYRRAKEKFGYLGVAKEREQHLIHQVNNEGLNVPSESYKENKKAAQNKVTDVAEICKGLPDRASNSVELNWIMCHPAMNRKHLIGSEKKDLVITVEDVMEPPSGPAPSKAAVIALQQWVHKPDEFFKMVLSEHRKDAGNEDPSKGREEVEDPTLDQVRRMLATLKTRRPNIESGKNDQAEGRGRQHSGV